VSPLLPARRGRRCQYEFDVDLGIVSDVVRDFDSIALSTGGDTDHVTR
jgi:hypothetical protein